MTSKIKVDNINKVSDDSNIINKCGTTVTIGAASDGVRTGANNLQASDGGNLISQSGTTITLGASGDTVQLASGASQSGFGRSGSVDWETTPKTSTFTAASGEGYFINSSGSITANLPAGSAGAIVAFSDYARNFNTHNFVISPNGSEKIGGVAASLTLDVNGQALTLIYVDSTKGWVNVQNAENTEKASAFIEATGGTITTCGDFKIHTFTGPGTFCVTGAGGGTPCQPSSADYLVIGGGGGSGKNGGGGGGGGGFRSSPGTASGSYTVSPLGASPAAAVTLTVQGYPITVGGGGSGLNGPGASNPGSNSSGLGIVSAGGGAGANGDGPCAGQDGGSGGGAHRTGPGGGGNTPPVNPPQGNNGHQGNGGGGSNGGGGGGAGAGGSAGGCGVGGNGGDGSYSNINPAKGVSDGPVGPGRYYSGGGGGGGASGSDPSGGAGGGGNGVAGAAGSPKAGSGTTNTGGGAGGGAQSCSGGGGDGGSGIVIIRYKFQ